MPSNTSKSYSDLSSIFRVINANLAKLYSSKQQRNNYQQKCQCKIRQCQKQQQIQFYTSQYQLISESATSFCQQSRSENEKLIGKILYMMIEHIRKIIEFLNQDVICKCMKQIQAQNSVLKHKLSFMRQQNDKFFKLYEQKSHENQILSMQIQQYNKKQLINIVPLTSIANHEQSDKQNMEKCSIGFPSSVNLNQEKSIKSSKISSCSKEGPEQINENVNKQHNWYFMLKKSRRVKKSHIFL